MVLSDPDYVYSDTHAVFSSDPLHTVDARHSNREDSQISAYSSNTEFTAMHVTKQGHELRSGNSISIT